MTSCTSWPSRPPPALTTWPGFGAQYAEMYREERAIARGLAAIESMVNDGPKQIDEDDQAACGGTRAIAGPATEAARVGPGGEPVGRMRAEVDDGRADDTAGTG